MKNELFEKYELIFKALGDKQRIRIVYELCKRGKVCVCDMCEIIDMPQSKLSYHLKILSEANIILKDKSGTWNYYSINEEIMKDFLPEKFCELVNDNECCSTQCCDEENKCC